MEPKLGRDMWPEKRMVPNSAQYVAGSAGDRWAHRLSLNMC